MSKTYKKNIKALKDCVPDFLNWLENEKKADWMERIKSNTGGANILVKAENGTTRPIYNMDMPQKDAKKIASGYDLNSNTVSVVVGLGCGYLTRQLLKKKSKKHKILVVEPIADMYHIALSLYDYSKAIRKGEIFFLTCEGDVRYILQKTEEKGIVENWYINVDNYAQVRPEYKELIKLTFNAISALRCNTGTVEGAGEIIAQNDIESLPYMIRKRGVSELKDLFKGKPAICISTGPSLEKNIHLLLDKKVRDKFVILAVGQALRVLLAYDIVPDLITSVDFGIVNFSHYKGLMDSGVPLVALNRSYAPLLKNWNAPMFITVSESPGYDDSITGLIQSKGSLLQGGSVAHMNFGLALHMGCEPITIIGQDLAWEGEKTHIRLADEMGSVKRSEDGSLGWDVDDPNTVIKGETQNVGGAIPLMGYYGKPVHTNVGLLSFHSGFEQLFKTVPTEVINATEGGAKIKNCKQLSLQQVIDKYGKKKINKTVLKPFLSDAEDGDELVEKALSLLKSDVENLKVIIKECKAGIVASNKLLKEKNKDRKIELLAINEKHSIEARKRSQKNALVMLAIYRVSRAITHRDLMPEASIKHLSSVDGRKDLKIRIRRNKQILKAAKEAAEKFIPLYEEAAELTKKGVGNPEPETLPDLKDVDSYFEKDNWAHPYLDAKRILKKAELTIAENGASQAVYAKCHVLRAETIRIAQEAYGKDKGAETVEFNDLVEAAQKLGRKEKDFPEALKLLEKAVKIKPDHDAVIWGLASTYHIVGDWKKSITYYDKLIEKYPDKTQYHFEKAIVNLKSGETKKSLEAFEEIMSDTEEYDYFYKSLGKLYAEAGFHIEAIVAYDLYGKKFGADHNALKLKCDSLEKIGKYDEAEKIKIKINKIKHSI